MKVKKLYIFAFIIIFLLALLGFKNYSSAIRKQGQTEIYQNQNRKLGIQKIRSAQTFWPLLKSDANYQKQLVQLNDLEQKPAVNIFIQGNISIEDIDNLISQLESTNGVKEVKFISHDEAFKKYQTTNQNDPALLHLVQPNLLPQSIEIYLDDFIIRKQIEQLAKSQSFVTDVIQLP